jgi:tetratricopeptide (TPR) repeat protein
MDVQRYLADETVQACPPSAGYRLRKFARRNKGRLVIAAGVCLAVMVIAATVGWAVGDRAARRATVAAMVCDSLNVARTFIAEDKLAAAREKLAEARAQLGHDRSSLADLATEVEAAEAELDRFQQFQELIERAHDAEMAPLLVATAADGSRSSSGSQLPVRTTDRRPSAAVPFLLEALQRYGVLEQNDWDGALEGGFLAKHQIEQIRRLAYEELLWLADDVARRRQSHVSDEKLSPAAAARRALNYLHKAERIHQPTPALYALRVFCHKALGDEAAAQADTQRAAKIPPTMAVDHYLRGQNAFGAKHRDEAVEAFEAALRLEPTHYWSMMKLGYCLCEFGPGPEDFTGAARVFTGCILKRPDHAHAYFCRARAYFRLGRYEESLADNNRAIELDPKFAPAWNNRGGDHNELGQPDQAVADFTQAIDLDAKLAIAWHNRAATYMKLRKLTEAIADYTKVIGIEPKHAEVWNDRGSAHFELGELKNALADFSQAIALDPKLAPVWDNRGMAHEQLGKLKEAMGDYSQAIKLDATFALTWFHRGMLYDKLNEPAKALADFSQAIKLDSNHALAWYNRGVVHNKLRQTDKAIADYTQAIKLNPTHAPTWTNRGLAHSKLGQPDKAIADLSEAIKLDPKHVPAWCGRGWDYSNLGRLEEAVADFSKAIELDANYPQLVSVYRLRAQANSRLGHHELARTDFQAALKREPDHAWTNSSLAWLLATCPDAKLRDPVKAIELAEKATHLAPKVADCWRTLGVAHYRAGEWKAAVAALDKSQQLSKGGDAADRLLLAMAHWKLGNQDEARKTYELAMQWMEKNREALEKDKGQADALRRFRVEAEALMNEESAVTKQKSEKKPN